MSVREPAAAPSSCTSAVAAREHGLLVTQCVRGVFDSVEAAAVPLEDLERLGVRPRRDLCDLFVSRLTERAKLELAVLAAHVDAIEGHRVTMWIETQRAVAART